MFGQKVKTQQQQNNRAQRALGRSPEEKVRGHSGAIYKGPLNIGRWPLDDVIHQKWKLSAL